MGGEISAGAALASAMLDTCIYVMGWIFAGISAVLLVLGAGLLLARWMVKRPEKTPTQPSRVIDDLDVPDWVRPPRRPAPADDTVVDGMSTELNRMLRGDGHG